LGTHKLNDIQSWVAGSCYHSIRNNQWQLICGAVGIAEQQYPLFSHHLYFIFRSDQM